jgi:hypothetical protein
MSERRVITLYDNNLPVDYKIVGTFELIPTWYPEQGPLLVGNFDYLFQEFGGEFP